MQFLLVYALYASQVWVTPFLHLGKTTKLAADCAEENYDGQGLNPFMVLHARIWSRASTVQLVSGGSMAVKCFNSKQ